MEIYIGSLISSIKISETWMLRRAAQAALRTLKPRPFFHSIQTSVPRQLLPFRAQYQVTSIFSTRNYVTQGSRGVPVEEEDFQFQTLTPEERERASLLKQAQLLNNLYPLLTVAEKKHNQTNPKRQSQFSTRC